MFSRILKLSIFPVTLVGGCIFDTPFDQDQADRARNLCLHFSTLGQSQETRDKRAQSCMDIQPGTMPPAAAMVPPVVPDMPQIMGIAGAKWATPGRTANPLECRATRDPDVWKRVHDGVKAKHWDDPNYVTKIGPQLGSDGKPIFEYGNCTSCNSTLTKECE